MDFEYVQQQTISAIILAKNSGGVKLTETICLLVVILALATIKNRWELYAIGALGFLLYAFENIPSNNGILALCIVASCLGRVIWCFVARKKVDK